MAQLIASAQITLVDLNDAIVTGNIPPQNPEAGAGWIDTNENPAVLKTFVIGGVAGLGATSEGDWLPQTLDLGGLDPVQNDKINNSDITLRNMSDDGVITQIERLTVKDKIAAIIGYVPLDTDSLPSISTLDSSGNGEAASSRQEALNAGILASDSLYIAVGTKYNALADYLNGMIPLPWNTVSTNDITLPDADIWRNTWLDYYQAVYDLSQAVASKLKSSIDDTKAYSNIMASVMTIDNTKTTYFAYDSNLCSTNGLNPNSGYISTLRKTEGKFGGAIAIEDASTNMLSASQQSGGSGTTGFIGNAANAFSSDATITISADTTVTWNDLTSVKVVTDGSKTTQGISTTGRTTVSPNTTYTMSVYVKGNGTVYIWGNGLAVNYGYSEYNTRNITLNNSSFQRLSYTFTTSATETAVAISIQTISTQSTTFWVAGLQLEQKTFPTSYTSGARSAGSLSYPNVLNQNAGTIGMWVNAESLIMTGSGYPMVFRLGNNIFEWSLWKDTLRVNSCSLTYPTQLSTNTWYYIAYTWNPSGQNAYLVYPDGTMATSNSIAAVPSMTGQTTMWIGCGATGSFMCNALIDDLRIDNRVLTSTEILAIHNSNSALYDPSPQVHVPLPSSVTMAIV